MGKEGKRWHPQEKKGSWDSGENWFGSVGLFLPQKAIHRIPSVCHASTQKEGLERKESLGYVKSKERDRQRQVPARRRLVKSYRRGPILLVRAECEVTGFDKATGPAKHWPKVV